MRIKNKLYCNNCGKLIYTIPCWQLKEIYDINKRNQSNISFDSRCKKCVKPKSRCRKENEGVKHE